MQAEDDGGQLGEIEAATSAVFPERTVGAAGILGETGCSLNAGIRVEGVGPGVWDSGIVIFFLNLLILFLLRHRWILPFLIFILIPVSSSVAEDAYVSPVSTSSTRSPEGGTVEQINPSTFPPDGEGALRVDPERAKQVEWINESVGVVVTPPAETVATPEVVESHSNIIIGKKPEWKWLSLELKGSMWFPENSVVEDFYGTCCNLGAEAEFGLLYKSKFNATVAVGFFHDSGQAVGVDSGLESGDRSSLLLVPIRNNFIFRADFKEEQILVPYAGAGLDYVVFRESVDGDSIKGLKFGFHGMGGVALLLDRIEEIGSALEHSGIDDVYFTVEGRYSKIDSFKSTGLDLSGFSAYFGFMMAF